MTLAGHVWFARVILLLAPLLGALPREPAGRLNKAVDRKCLPTFEEVLMLFSTGAYITGPPRKQL